MKRTLKLIALVVVQPEVAGRADMMTIVDSVEREKHRLGLGC